LIVNGTSLVDYNNDWIVNAQPNTKMRDSFRQYCARACESFRSLTRAEKRGIGLLVNLQTYRTSLDAYSAFMLWFHREVGDIGLQDSLKYVARPPGDGYISRHKLLKLLKTRYNMDSKFPKTKPIFLPSTQSTVSVTLHNAWDCIESLLTDPRITDEDYNFYNNDPFSKPPKPAAIGELHTANAYYEAYNKYITNPEKQVLLPFLMYIDGAVTGQFQNLPITALKISLGIFRRKVRDKDYAWRTLGYVTDVSKQSARGRQLFHATAHIDSGFVGEISHPTFAEMEGAASIEGEEAAYESRKFAHKAQDLHTMLDCLLESFREVQKNGFIWDLRYRGTTYTDVEFVPFVMFIKCDTDEGDQLCGSYTSRGNGVAQLCRRCTCPTDESDLVKAEFPPKTTQMVSLLIKGGKDKELRALSQQNIDNAWYKIRFHPATEQGIHGACPSEMLHALLLGIFKYTRDCFFEQIGPSTALSDEIDALSQTIGDAFGRQSERDMPKCKFKQGIRRGKIMAKEFRGILLVMAAILRCKKGRDLLANSEFFSPTFLNDWTLLVEVLLQWEAFLNEPEMLARHVKAMEHKNRYIMYLMKVVARRQRGMGLKLTKFHMITHLWHDIHLYGVPLEVDTGSNESHHKKTKVAARLTQKNEATLDLQTCTRLDEFSVVELALLELEGKPLWEYYSRMENMRQEEEEDRQETDGDNSDGDDNLTKGTHIAVKTIMSGDSEDIVPVYWHGSEGANKTWKPAGAHLGNWDVDVVKFLIQLQDKLGGIRLKIRGEHRRAGIIFRGHPNYRGKPWRDWAMFDWGDQQQPGQIWCFVVVDTVRHGQEPIVHGGIHVLNATYAVIECTKEDQTAQERTRNSEIFLPYVKEVKHRQSDKKPWKRKFYLADVESIVRPLVVIPNMGGQSGCEFLLVKSRSEWVADFKEWLDESPNDDVIGQEEPEPSHPY